MRPETRGSKLWRCKEGRDAHDQACVVTLRLLLSSSSFSALIISCACGCHDATLGQR